MAAMATLGLRLVHLIALALGCPRDYFDVAFSKASTTLRPLHYSSDVSNPTHGLFGAGELFLPTDSYIIGRRNES